MGSVRVFLQHKMVSTVSEQSIGLVSPYTSYTECIHGQALIGNTTEIEKKAQVHFSCPAFCCTLSIIVFCSSSTSTSNFAIPHASLIETSYFLSWCFSFSIRILRLPVSVRLFS